MSETIYKGTISFIHHEKQYVAIDYVVNGRKKTINSRMDGEMENPKTRKKHHYRVGDEVNFRVKLSGRGDKMIAYHLQFLYNTALERLISKAAAENRFAGYLKAVDDVLYVKERDSYIFFPLKLSKWENPPAESAHNEVINFKLLNLDKPAQMAAELFSHNYIPEYRQAMTCFQNKKIIEATVSKITPFAVYLDLFGDKVQARLKGDKSLPELAIGDKMPVRIAYLGSDRVIAEQV